MSTTFLCKDRGSVEIIEEGVFQECSKLETVNIPDTVTFIGCNAFKECTSLKM